MKNIIRIYDRYFKETGITGDFTCLEAIREYRGAGRATLHLPAGKSAGLLMPDGYIMAPDGVMYRITDTERDIACGTVSVKCAGLLAFLSGTVIPEEYSVTGDVFSLMYSLARKGAENLPLLLSLGNSSSGKSVTLSSGRSYLYDDLVSLCYLGGIGMKMEYTGSKLLFTAYPARDRTDASDDPVLVSRKMGTFEGERVLWELGGYRNVAVVNGAEKESGGRYTVTVKSCEQDFGDGFPDSEYFPRQTSVNFTSPIGPFMTEDTLKNRVLDENAYTEAMRLCGAAVLGRCRPKLTLVGTYCTDTAVLEPGDTVTLCDSDTGVSGTAVAERIVSVWSKDSRSIKTELCADISPAFSAKAMI